MAEQQTPMKDEDYLDHNQRLRHDIVVHLTTSESGDKRIPGDNETLNTLKGFLKDSDSSVFNKRRVMVEEAGVENDKRAADIIESALGQLTRNGRDGDVDARSTGPVIDESQLPNFDITEGAMSQVGDAVDLDQVQRDGRRIRKGEE